MKYKPESRQWNDKLQKTLAENHTLNVTVLDIASDRDKLRDALREIVRWVKWDEFVTGRRAIPFETFERVKKVLGDTE